MRVRTRQEPRPEEHVRRLRSRLRIWVGCAVALFLMAASAALFMRPVTATRSAVDKGRRSTAALQQVAALRTTLTNFQLLLEPSLSAPQTPAYLSNKLASAAQLTQTISTQTNALTTALPAIGHGAAAKELASSNTSFTRDYTGLAPLAAGQPLAKSTMAIASERAGFALMWTASADVAKQLQQDRDDAFQTATSSLTEAHSTVLTISGLGAFAVLVAAFMFGQRAYRRERRERADTERQKFATSLAEALEMASVESGVYGIVGKALTQTVPLLQVELLVADSSRAHFHQALSVVSTRSEPRSGCGVGSPLDCPATVRGHTLVFPSSKALNACPHLLNRASGDCSAVCVPISIAGKTVGVTHATGPDDAPPSNMDVRYLELTSRRASERIAMLRAFQKSETQASSDPLTGLANRRSLENRVRDLQREGVTYAVAYGDLDHFKLLNDTHGHEAGDQALRLFSRVLRESVRPTDIAARYGGEEFVLILPGSDTETATIVLERVRERLALALAAGRIAPFTVSFGLAASTDAATFDEVVAAADQALLRAKAAGRNRVVVALADTATSDSSA